MEGTTDAIYVKDLKGRYVLVNKSTCKAIGKKREEIIGKADNDLFPPESQTAIKKTDSKVLESGQTVTEEERLLTSYGDTYWLANKSPLFDQSGKIVGLIGISRNITDRKKAEEALREKDAMLANLASQVPGMLYRFKMAPDGSFSVPYSSQGVTDIFGCSPEDVHDDFDPIFKAIHPEDRDQILKTIDESVKHMSQWKCEYRVQLPGRPIKWIFGNSVPEKRADGSIVWSGYNVDITERKKAEEILNNHKKRLIREKVEKQQKSITA